MPMPLISRRNVLSTGIAATATALLPSTFLPFPNRPNEPENIAALSSTGGQIEHVEPSIFSKYQQEAILNLARQALTKLFTGETISDLESEARALALPSVERVNITLRHAGRIRGSMSAPGENLGKQIVESVFRAATDQIDCFSLTCEALFCCPCAVKSFV